MLSVLESKYKITAAGIEKKKLTKPWNKTMRK